MRSRRWFEPAAATLAIAALLGAAGWQKRSPAIEYMPTMAYGPRVTAQAEDPIRPGLSVQRAPVPGTVARNLTPYRFDQGDTTEAMAALVNPLPRTAEVLGRGQRVYQSTCVVCHGARGDGQGSIVPLFPQPPVLVSDKVRDWPDSRIFHVITQGQNLMPSYASIVLPEDRWAVVHYVRALQRAARPLPQDLPARASAGGAVAAGAAADTTGSATP